VYRKIALLLGNGRYALYLHQRLKQQAHVASLTYSLLPIGLSVFADADIDAWLDILDPGTVRAYLDRQSVTNVVFGGDFSQGHFEQTTAILSGASLSDEVPTPLAAHLRLLSETVLGTGSSKSKIEPIIASKLLPDLKPGSGIIVSAGRLSKMSEKDIVSHVRGIVRQARERLTRQPVQGARQAMLFDGEDLAQIGYSGTDVMLRSAAKAPRPHAIRTLVNLGSSGADNQWDPPVVGQQTLEAALNAYVDLAIVEADLGILFQREATIRLCREAGIMLFGAS
jgi:DUF1009 family protein